VAITDIFRIGQIKDDLEKVKSERNMLKSTLDEFGHLDAVALKQAVANLEEKKANLQIKISQLDGEYENRKSIFDKQLDDLIRETAEKQKQLVILDEEILLQEFGLYKPKYGLETSDAYKRKLETIQTEQSAMVKANNATSASTDWTLNGSKTEGAKMVKDYVKLILRAFNNECDAGISSVKFNNIESIEKRIQKSFETLNKLGAGMRISITRPYLNLRLQELYLVYEYQQKRQEEREEQKRLREQMREEARVMREIEEEKQKIEKEEKHFLKALANLDKQIGNTDSEEIRQELEQEKQAIVAKLGEVESQKSDVLNRERNTRAGYVYVISNLGAFGENIYKIGVTRRLDPQERIDELGDASVPFNFDIHALIFSDDAPKLEGSLHKAFANRRLNMINARREFFKVTLDEIENVVRKNFNKPVDFVRICEAEEYRESIVLHEKGWVPNSSNSIAK